MRELTLISISPSRRHLSRAREVAAAAASEPCNNSAGEPLRIRPGRTFGTLRAKLFLITSRTHYKLSTWNSSHVDGDSLLASAKLPKWRTRRASQTLALLVCIVFAWELSGPNSHAKVGPLACRKWAKLPTRNSVVFALENTQEVERGDLTRHMSVAPVASRAHHRLSKQTAANRVAAIAPSRSAALYF